MNPAQAGALAPAVLAHIGDAVLELSIRERMVRNGTCRTARNLHRATVALVRASSQARMARILEDSLTAAEKDILRRGRNAHCGRVPSRVDVTEYRLATGLECLLGYLHLAGQTARVRELIETALAGLARENARNIPDDSRPKGDH